MRISQAEGGIVASKKTTSIDDGPRNERERQYGSVGVRVANGTRRWPECQGDRERKSVSESEAKNFPCTEVS